MNYTAAAALVALSFVSCSTSRGSVEPLAVVRLAPDRDSYAMRRIGVLPIIGRDMRAEDKRALIAFLSRAQSEDKRVVLVVTGKGGVLREALPLWLGQADLQPLVSGIAEAHIKHGGAGAFYVSLRRTRASR